MSGTPPLVEAHSIGKRFKLYRSPNQRLLEWLSFGRSVRHRGFWALEAIEVAIRHLHRRLDAPGIPLALVDAPSAFHEQASRRRSDLVVLLDLSRAKGE